MEFRDLGLRLEARKESVENVTGSCRKFSFLEPDLAYIQIDYKVEVSSVSSKSYGSSRSEVVNDTVCFRGEKPGHFANRCSIKQGIFCYWCK